MKRNLFALALLSFCLMTSTQGGYGSHYPNDMVNEMDHGSKQDNELVDFIRRASRLNHHPLSYSREAKMHLFQEVDLNRDADGYYIKDVYCNHIVRGVSPRKSPRNNIMNAEHTWPQSKGSKAEPFRGDLHHLFPSDTRANSTRGNSPFGEVVDSEDATPDCSASQKGQIADPRTGRSTGQRGFQPPPEHRGNVARALFYGAVAYGYHIDEVQEYYLKKWHKEDPVDEEEIGRNDSVSSAQGNRNPFIDFPQIVDRIKDF